MRRGEHEPPYRLVPGHLDRLEVREDLVSHLAAEKATLSPISAEVVGYGTLEFAPGAAYSARVPFDAYVEQVLVDLDDVVERGQPLATLRSPTLARLRAELENDLVLARAEEAAVRRLEPLVRDGTASERELAEARSRLEAAHARAQGTRAALAAAGIQGGKGERFTLRATQGGRVIKRSVDPGERVVADGEPLFVIGDPERLVVRASFPERDALHLREGARCRVSLHSISGRELEGTITRIARTLDPTTRAADAICEPTSGGAGVGVGAKRVARVSVEVTADPHVIVPRSALLLRRDEPVVFVRVAENVLERRHVELGLQLGDHVQIVEGVSAGEEVVVEGAVLLDGELDVLL